MVVSTKLCFGQSDSSSFFHSSKEFNKNRFVGLISSEAIVFTGSMIGLGQLWYSDYEKSSFHFINDNRSWLQMDKVGHFASAYYLTSIGSNLFKWTGTNNGKSVFWGAQFGMLFLTSIEILDGFSENWGASSGDLIANFGGGLFSIAQSLAWKEQRVLCKFSFHTTSYSKYRPNLLGDRVVENVFKDYNGQSYWLSINVASFMKGESRFPKWLNVAVGYGAEGMLGASENPSAIDGEVIPHFDRYRKVLFSLDIDLSRIKTKSPVLKCLFKTFSIFKIPFPALEYNKLNGVIVHPIYL